MPIEKLFIVYQFQKIEFIGKNNNDICYDNLMFYYIIIEFNKQDFQ